jgi:CHAD domain-containing protein
MSLQLKSDQSLRKNLRRIARKQIDSALEELTGPKSATRDEAVHEARKSLKKVRAVLRLVRPVIGEADYRDENTCYRDAARPLTEVRDARILIETLDKTAEHFEDYIAGRSFADVRKKLEDNLRAVRRRVLDKHQAFVVVAETISQARSRLKDWTDVPNRWSSIGPGLEKVCRQARTAFTDAASDPSVPKLHEWRKQAKYLRYQLEVLQPLWPQRIDELASECDKMGELLGDDHDLAVFRQTSIDKQLGQDDAERGALLALIDRRRIELVQEVLLLGDRFFREKPKELSRQLKGYWRRWGDQASTVRLPLPSASA